MKLILSMLLLVSNFALADYHRLDYRIWSDFDKNCLDTRQEILKRDARVVLWINKCVVKNGVWIDSYTGELLKDVKTIDIDHVVPLQYADSHGLTQQLKPKFGNDISNLLVTSAHLNRSKGSKSISAWHPNMPYLCKYATIWKDVGVKYELQYDEADRRFISDTLTQCSK